ncbi:regulatory LuxR family protein [Rubrivivax gelatinosus]|uniref:Regulatory LuxR family protein n=1 Tax=Rubrivivax gelatinosus TaxID=28068 RepID=A0A4R2MD41_RUBGE|nr:regulatory LuxR family protein [Rubrivivax gelatinosus]
MRAVAPRLETLSAREREVMAFVVAGHTSKEIARRLGISPLTVRKHRENLMRKLEVATTARLVALVGPRAGACG